MSNVNYRAYIESTKELVLSIVIKSSLAARAINQELILQGYDVNEDRPDTWKYYLNLAGLPHESDATILITSLDTMEQIPFTYEMLSQHRATLTEYVQRGEYYTRLVDTYPESLGLINGVLNPVDMDYAIGGDEHIILNYNKDLIESQETQLISQLQTRIVNFFNVYTVEGYTLTDELYLSVLFTSAYANMMKDLLALRLKACHTENAHTFHVWSYLSGYFSLDDFKSVLSIDQALYLYRNIRTIADTTYSTQTFNDLVEVFLTSRSIPLYAYNLNHNVSDIEETHQVQVEHEKILLNFNSGLDKADSRRSVKELLLDSVTSATDNELTVLNDERDVVKAIAAGNDSRYITKVLEADITDTSLTEGIALIELTYTEWLRLSTDSRYRLRTTVPNPSGGGAVTLDAKEAFTLLIYLSYRSFDLNIEDIPVLTDFACLRNSPPSLTELKKGELGVSTYDTLIDEMRTFPQSGTIISSIVFRRYIEDLKAHLLRCKQITYNEGGIHENVSLESIYTKFFYPRTYTLSTDKRYEDWLDRKGLDLYGVNPDIAANLSTVILEKFTGGSDYDGSKLFRAHKAMLDIVERLSHHDLQFVRNLNDRPALSALAKGVRMGDAKFSSREEVVLLSNIIDIWSEGAINHETAAFYGGGDYLEAYSKGKLVIELGEGPSLTIDATFRSETVFNIGHTFFEVETNE